MKGELQGKGRRTSPRDKESAKGRCIQGRGSALRAGAYREGEGGALRGESATYEGKGREKEGNEKRQGNGSSTTPREGQMHIPRGKERELMKKGQGRVRGNCGT